MLFWPFVRYNLDRENATIGIGVFFEDGDWHLSFARSIGFDTALKLLPEAIADAFRPSHWTSEPP